MTSRKIYLLGILITILLKPVIVNCQDRHEEITVLLNVLRIGNAEIQAIVNNDTAYLPVKEVFDFLKIKNTLSPSPDIVEGFFINPKAVFIIDKKKNRIVYQHKTFDLKEDDLICTETNLYLRSDYFGEVFGLQCAFSIRDLTVTLSTTLELPAILELRQLQMHQNIRKLAGEKKADTIIKRNFSLFKLGMADWLINTTQEKNQINTSLNLDIGAMIAGGETNLYLNFPGNRPFSFKDQNYRWRYVNNDNKILRQVTAGKIFTQSISTISAPVTGIQFTNTPTTNRKSYGTYRLSDKTEPGNIVELYVNNELVNYTKADASGFYTFDMPLVYGNSIIKLRFYGSSGEEHTREQYITIPFNFIPQHQLEYTVTAGIVNDNKRSRFLRSVANYGLTRYMTLGGGIEYSGSAQGKPIPFLNASIQLISNLVITGEYADDARLKGVISYHLPSHLQVDLNYIKYHKGQTTIKNNYSEERRAVLSMPFQGKNFRGLSRLSINHFVLSKFNYTNAEFLLSSVIHGINSNITTTAEFARSIKPEVYSNVSVTFHIPAGIKITPQIKYEYGQKKVNMIRLEAEKKLFSKGIVNLSYEKIMNVNNQSISAAFRYNFSFSQTAFSVKQANHIITTTASARGSMVYDNKITYVRLTNHANVGKGGIIISAFLDLNCNGQHELNEPKVQGLKIHINGGVIEHNKQDTDIRIFGLEANKSYFIELDKNSFETIAWQIKNPIIKVMAEPDHFNLIEVPVAVMGEVSGTVFLHTNNGSEGIERIKINIYNNNSVLVGKTVTESDGSFNFMGLRPGNYMAAIDTAQLQKLKLISSPDLSFTILSNKDGDSEEDLKFFCRENLKSDCLQGKSKDSDHDGVPDSIDKELITPASCFPVDTEGVGKCILYFKETL